MAKYLAYTSPARGHLYPIVDTLLELRHRGQEVHVRTLASEVPGLTDLGLHAGAIDPAIERLPLDDWEGASPEEALRRALAIFSARAVFEEAELSRAIDELEPDALLIDITTVGAAAVAEATGLPWAQTIPLFQHFSPDMPPATLTMVPFELHPAGIEVLNASRARVGLAPINGSGDVWRAPLHLYYTSKPFEVPGLDIPPSFRLLGPGLWEPSREEPGWLDAIDKPLVLLSVSSEFQRDDLLVEAAIDALSADDMQLVVTTAAHDPNAFPAVSNVLFTRWQPHGPLIRKAACVICHGGMGITQKALAEGVPVCVVPFGRDQFEVARRVVEVGAGTAVLPTELEPTALRKAIHRAMTMQQGAGRISEAFARAGGARTAADEVESLLADRAVTTPADAAPVPRPYS